MISFVRRYIAALWQKLRYFDVISEALSVSTVKH